MTDEETVLTSRRALLRSAGRGWTPGRLRISDRRVRFTGQDGAVLDLDRSDVAAVRLTRAPRRALELDTATGPVRLRCFGMPAVAVLLRG